MGGRRQRHGRARGVGGHVEADEGAAVQLQAHRAGRHRPAGREGRRRRHGRGEVVGGAGPKGVPPLEGVAGQGGVGRPGSRLAGLHELHGRRGRAARGVEGHAVEGRRGRGRRGSDAHPAQGLHRDHIGPGVGGYVHPHGGDAGSHIGVKDRGVGGVCPGGLHHVVTGSPVHLAPTHAVVGDVPGHRRRGRQTPLGREGDRGHDLGAPSREVVGDHQGATHRGGGPPFELVGPPGGIGRPVAEAAALLHEHGHGLHRLTVVGVEGNREEPVATLGDAGARAAGRLGHAHGELIGPRIGHGEVEAGALGLLGIDLNAVFKDSDVVEQGAVHGVPGGRGSIGPGDGPAHVGDYPGLVRRLHGGFVGVGQRRRHGHREARPRDACDGHDGGRPPLPTVSRCAHDRDLLERALRPWLAATGRSARFLPTGIPIKREKSNAFRRSQA